MELFHALTASLLSPMVLSFVLGVIVTLIRSDLKLPPELYSALTIYLLFAIGMKGGANLAGTSFGELAGPVTAAIGLGIAIPVWSYWILQRFGRFDTANAAALAAHYGSVSAVTFAEGMAFLEILRVPHEPFLPALLAIMEIPGILVAIFLFRKLSGQAAGVQSGSFGRMMHELLSGKSIVLLVGGLIIGVLAGKEGFAQVAPVFDAPFRGLLCLFLLEIGIVTGKRLPDLVKAGPFLVAFGLIMPLLHGALGVWLGKVVGLSLGGSTILGVLAASASYIAAPAAIRLSIPQASPTYYLTASLAITFPLNVTVGIPLYYWFAKVLYL
jgi:hypothetical protein